jgi:hypothetical protein
MLTAVAIANYTPSYTYDLQSYATEDLEHHVHDFAIMLIGGNVSYLCSALVLSACVAPYFCCYIVLLLLLLLLLTATVAVPVSQLLHSAERRQEAAASSGSSDSCSAVASVRSSSSATTSAVYRAEVHIFSVKCVCAGLLAASCLC